MFSPAVSENGGAQKRSLLIAESLARAGFSVVLIGRGASIRRATWTRRGGLSIVEIPGFGHRRLGAALFLAVGIPLGVIAGLRARGFVALQLSSPSTAAVLCGTLLRRPSILLTSTSGTLSEARSAPRARRALLARATILVGQTESSARELRAASGHDRVAVIPNPVEAQRATPLPSTPRAVFTGRLSEEKDLFGLLDAWAGIAARHPAARLRIVGDGGAFRSVEAPLRGRVAADPLLRDSVHFTGWLPDVRPELLAAAVFVLPSRSEGMSNALLEACAYGRVVVASDIEPNRAVLGNDYPLLVPVGETAVLERALESALLDENLRRDALDAVAARMNTFRPEAIAAELVGLFDA